MDHRSRSIRNRDWLEGGEEAGYTSTSVSYSVKVCTRLSLSVVNWLSKNNFITTVKCQNVVKTKMQAILVLQISDILVNCWKQQVVALE